MRENANELKKLAVTDSATPIGATEAGKLRPK